MGSRPAPFGWTGRLMAGGCARTCCVQQNGLGVATRGRRRTERSPDPDLHLHLRRDVDLDLHLLLLAVLHVLRRGDERPVQRQPVAGRAPHSLARAPAWEPPSFCARAGALPTAPRATGQSALRANSGTASLRRSSNTREYLWSVHLPPFVRRLWLLGARYRHRVRSANF